MRSNCRSPSLIPLPDSSYLKFRNSMPVSRGKKSWRPGKRSILIKVRSDVTFKDEMQKDALFWGILFVAVMGRNILFHGSTSHFVTYQLESKVPCFGALLRSEGVRCFSTPLEGIEHNGDLLLGNQVGQHFRRSGGRNFSPASAGREGTMAFVPSKGFPLWKALLWKLILPDGRDGMVYCHPIFQGRPYFTAYHTYIRVS